MSVLPALICYGRPRFVPGRLVLHYPGTARVDGTAIHFMPMRWRLLALLCAAQGAGILLTREVVFDAMWGDDPMGGPCSRVLDVHLVHLRKQIAPLGLEIVTRWGVGHFIREVQTDNRSLLIAA